MWFLNHKGHRLFRHGREDYDAAARAAEACHSFQEDVDEECVTDESRSCYNCRFRRWTADSFQCQGHLE